MDRFRNKNDTERKRAHISLLKRTKRRLRVTLALIISAACAAVFLCGSRGVYAEPDKISDAKFVMLDDPGYLDFFSGSCIRNLEYGYEDDVGFARILLTPMGSDPFIFMPISLIEGGINCEEYPYVAISVRSPFPSRCNLYFGTSNEGGLDETKNLPSSNSITESGDWETIVFYGLGNAKWNGLLTTARFDPYGVVPDGMEYIDIRWMAFVKSEEDLEKLDVSIDDFNQSDVYTRRPVYSTPNRTKPPENTYRPEVTVYISGSVTSGGFSPVVLITVTSVLVLCIAVCAAGIIVIKRKNRH